MPGWPEWLETTEHIGSHYPFYIEREDTQRLFSLRIEDVVEEIPQSERVIDPAAMLEIVFSGRPLGNRTLLRGVNRTPWLAAPTDGGWSYHDIPSHKRKIPSCDNVTRELRNRLRTEILNYTAPNQTVGLLLSGGLDSRILAGMLRSLQHDEVIGKVVALTWGLEDSCDVVYARQIAERFSWDFRHYPLSVETLRRNIKLNGELGAEFAPYHLHAMPEVRTEPDLDVVLAGSYGNSVGRAEYAGNRVTELKKTVPKRLNRFGVVQNTLVSDNKHTVRRDAYGYRSRVSRTEPYQYREIEQQLHYMRRNLQACMTHIAEKIPLYQIFTSPDVVELMWGLDPSIRDDRYYVQLLEQLPGNLTSIPDPKTGKKPGGSKKIGSSELSKVYNEYGNWLRHDLDEYVTNLVLDLIDRSNIFNDDAIRRLVRVWKRAETKTTNQIDSIIAWLASLGVFVDQYNVEIEIDGVSGGIIDVLNRIFAPSHALIYQEARGWVRE